MSDTATVAKSYDQYESKLELRVVVLCTMLSALMQGIDSTIANVALPFMQGSLAASRDQVTWVLTSYIVSAAIMTAPVGWIASRFGRKNLALVSIAGFTLASMLCGAAQTLDQMILFRMLQGAFGAALSPLSQSIMLDLYPLEKRGQMMAIWAMGAMVGPIVGPTLGGYLTENYNWRWVFYVNLPFGIAAFTGMWIFFRETRRDDSLKFDWFGFGLLATGIGALQLLLDRGSDKDWLNSSEIIIEMIVAGLGIYLFTVHLLLSKGTFIPKEIFKNRSFMTSLMLTFLLGLVLFASTALLPTYLQNLAGFSARQTGLLMTPRGIGMVASMLIVGQFSYRIDPRKLMVAGTLLLLWSLWEMSRWTPSVSAWHLAVTTLLQGIGSGMMFVPMNLISFSTLPASLRTSASAFLNLVRNTGSSIGISITSTYLAVRTQIEHGLLAEHVTTFNRALSQNGPGMMWNPQITFGVQALDRVVNYNAQVIAYSNVFLFMFLASVPALLVIFTMKRPSFPTASAPHEFEVIE